MVEVRPMFQSGSSRVIITAPTPGVPTTFLSASELQKKENTAIQLLFFKPKQEGGIHTNTSAPVTVMSALPTAPAPIMPPTVIVEDPVAPLDLSCKKRAPSGEVVSDTVPEAVLIPMVPLPSLPIKPETPMYDMPPMNQLLPGTHVIVNNVCSSLDEPQFIPRSNSDASTCSNTSSTYGDDRRLKRKEQNKAAAQTYRQRKKSSSDKVECEYDVMSRKNCQLRQQKNKLEDRISKMRSLLNEVVRSAKQEEGIAAVKEEAKAELAIRPRASSLSWHPGVNAPPAALRKLEPIRQLAESPIPECPSGASTPPLQQPSIPATPTMVLACGQPAPPSALMPHPDDFSNAGPMRARKYTWPLTLTGKDRKKEQNKLASRRFRQRRKHELSHSDVEAAVLENNNTRLRERCDEMERKINQFKDVIGKINARLGTDLVAAARSQEAVATVLQPVAAFSSLSIHSPPRREMME